MATNDRLSATMWSKIKAIFGFGEANPDELTGSSDGEARARLQELRESELSVGASYQRGIPVSRAPGQISSSSVVARSSTSAPEHAAGAHEQQTTRDDVALSMTTAYVTGSMTAGYLAGGSIAGAAVGASLADSAPTDLPFDSTDSTD